jgi:hypothetical protein
VGTYNSTGQKYCGHFSIWITNRLQERLIYLEDILSNLVYIRGWVNGNLYLPTSETIGILPVPPELRAESKMADFNVNIDQKQRHAYLASMQGTRKAILPVHTPAEHDLFNTLMKTNEAFTSRSAGPRWTECVRVWNRLADTRNDVFYKVRIPNPDLSFPYTRCSLF